MSLFRLNVGNNNSAIDGRAGNEKIRAGNGADVVFVGTNDTISLGNGNDTVIGGSGSTVTVGNGNDAIFGGANDVYSLGNGQDQLVAGTDDTWTVGTGPDTFTFNSSGFDHDVINGFNTSRDVLQFNPALFANYMAVFGATKQVGSNAVIADSQGDQITLTGVTASHLTASNIKIA